MVKILREYLSVLLTPTRVFFIKKMPIYPFTFLLLTLGTKFAMPEKYGNIFYTSIKWGTVVISLSIAEYIYRKLANKLPR